MLFWSNISCIILEGADNIVVYINIHLWSWSWPILRNLYRFVWPGMANLSNRLISPKWCYWPAYIRYRLVNSVLWMDIWGGAHGDTWARCLSRRGAVKVCDPLHNFQRGACHRSVMSSTLGAVTSKLSNLALPTLPWGPCSWRTHGESWRKGMIALVRKTGLVNRISGMQEDYLTWQFIDPWITVRMNTWPGLSIYPQCWLKIRTHLMWWWKLISANFLSVGRYFMLLMMLFVRYCSSWESCCESWLAVMQLNKRLAKTKWNMLSVACHSMPS